MRPAMAKLRPITETCVPRDDVLTGGLDDSHFAVQLDRVIREPEKYPLYGDPDQFFDLTWPTRGLQDLLNHVFGRFSGVAGRTSGLVRSETSFGGGKTHGLIALYHLAKGARPANLRDFVNPKIIPAECQIAGVVGDRLDSVNDMTVNGVTTRTLWGVIAAQLGPEHYEMMRKSDETRTVPAKERIEMLLGDTPTIIVIDEIAHYMRTLNSSGDPDVRRMADAVPAFLKSLLEVASEQRNLVVVLTFASNADAYGEETSELNAALDHQMAEISSVVSRSTKGSSIVKPAEDSEIAEILKRRLFVSIDTRAAKAAGREYGKYYTDLKDKGETLTGGAEHAAPYAEQIEASYPFHPELIRVLDKRLGTIPDFQRARGALKLLAEAVAGIWDEPDDSPYQHPEVINVADLDYDKPELLLHLTAGLKKPLFENVAKVDFVGRDSHAARLDADRYVDRLPYSARAARTVFTHSLETHGSVGADRSEVVLGTARVGDSPDIIMEALNTLDGRAWYLTYTGRRYKFSTEPNANKIITSEAETIAKSAVRREVEDRIRALFPDADPVKTIVFPSSGPADVPDVASLRLVVVHYDEVKVTSKTASPAHSRVMAMYDTQGGSETPRVYRNALAFLVADADAIETMLDRVRSDMAAESVVNNAERLREYGPEVQEKLAAIASESRMAARTAIANCFRHLYVPDSDRSTGYLRHEDASVQHIGDMKRSETQRVVEWMRSLDNVVRTTPLSADYLLKKVWPRAASTDGAASTPVGHVSTRDLQEQMWRDNRMPYMLDVTRLTDVIREGIERGNWVYWDTTTERAYTDKDPVPSVRLDSDVVLYLPDEAAAKGLLGRDPSPDDVVAALGSRASLSGPMLRDELEKRLGTEPTKQVTQEALARAADGGERAKVVVVEGDPVKGAKSLTPGEIRKKSLDRVTLVTPAKADDVGVVRVEGRTRRASDPTATDSIGVAFQSVLDGVSEVPGSPSISGITISASVQSDDEAKRISLLREVASAAAMVPLNSAYTKRVRCSVTGSFVDKAGNPYGDVEVSFDSEADQFTRIEDKIFGLVSQSAAADGELSFSIVFVSSVRHDDRVIERIRKPLLERVTGEVTVTAELDQS